MNLRMMKMFSMSPIARAVVNVIKDPLWYKVVLLMKMDNVYGNTVFVDDAGHSTMVFGTAAIAATPKFGNGAMAVQDVNSSIEVVGGAEYSLPGDFTVEFFVNSSTVQTQVRQFIGQWGTYNSWQAQQNASGNLLFQTAAVSHFGTAAQALPNDGLWHHVAITRQGSTLRAFIDGVLKGTETETMAIPYTAAGRLGVGKVSGQAGYGMGKGVLLDEVRITNGAARYTTDFTPPALEYGLVGNWWQIWNAHQMLLHCDGAEGSTTITDATKMNTWTARGGAKITTQGARFGSCLSFSRAANSYVEAPYRQGWSFGLGDFTIQTWANLIDVLGSGTGGPASVLVRGSGGAADGSGLGSYSFYVTPTAQLAFSSAENTTSQFNATTADNTIIPGKWQHLVVQRAAGVLSLYVDGKKQTITLTGNNPSGVQVNCQWLLRLGTSVQNSTWSGLLNGYLDEVAIIKGRALYSGDFVPPSIPTVDPIDVYSTKTTFLSHFDGADQAKVATDEFGSTVTMAGNSYITTAKSMFGKSCIYFGGTAYADYATIAAHPGVSFGADDFTIECWLNIDGTQASGINAFFAACNDYIVIAINGGKLSFWNGAAGSWMATSSVAFPANKWVHVAFTRQGSTLMVFQDGVLVGSGVADTVYPNSDKAIFIGGRGPASNQVFKGWMDELRITKGAARYTTNFAPSTIPFIG